LDRRRVDLIIDPSTFEWATFTEELGPIGTDEEHHVETVSDGGIDPPVTWPSVAE
jgi:hypothetical protein